MRLGAHMSTAGGVTRALERGAGIGCEVVQLFVKNNMQWLGKPVPAGERRAFCDARKRLGLAAVFGHTGYLISLGGPASANRDRSIESMIQEVELAAALELPFLVLHPGAHLGRGEGVGLRQVVAGLKEVFRATRGLRVRVALENTAGQGTCLGAEIRHLGMIYEGMGGSERLGVCLDTAHLFASGYDIRTRTGWDRAMAEVEECVGLGQVLAVHLNDSKADLGSRVDRHAGIGEGRIGREAFRHVVNDTRLVRVPGCLETPKSVDLHEDVANLAVLRGLMRRRRGGGTRRVGCE
jgi:deoxyribonuclease IV